MLSPLLLILAQATPMPPPRRIDVLARQCPDPVGGEVVVCGKTDVARLPLPEERGPPDRPMPSNPDLAPVTALAEAEPPCATVQGGCQVGVDLFGMGTAAVRLLGKLVSPNSCCDEPGQSTNPALLIRDLIGGLKKKPDKSNRVAIDLDAPPPSLAGRLSR